MNTELTDFRSAINRRLSRGDIELPVVDDNGRRLVVFALATDPLFTLLLISISSTRWRSRLSAKRCFRHP